MVSISGCWAEQPLIHDAFTAAQWAHLQKTYAPPEKPQPVCSQNWQGVTDCNAASKLGQQLFFEPRLSGPWIAGAPAAKTSCATCHDPVSAKAAGWFVDTREDNAVSQGAFNPTPHNTISVVNLYVGDRDSYAWTGQCKDQPCLTPTNVVHDIALPKAMASDAAIVARAIRGEAEYVIAYRRSFGKDPWSDSDADVQKNVERALDLYMRKLVSLDAPFDRFITGDDSAISASAKHGFALFVGKAMCSECHGGSMFTDVGVHVTGVEDQDGDLDPGFQNTGGFYTPGLRHVAQTSPYMHNGSQDTLADVIEFYRWGGGDANFHGMKDPLMHDFVLEDGEAQQLEAFMHTLTGASLTTEVRADTHVTATSCALPQVTHPGRVCGNVCRDIFNDRLNCGGCGIVCTSYCMDGVCGP